MIVKDYAYHRLEWLRDTADAATAEVGKMVFEVCTSAQ